MVKLITPVLRAHSSIKENGVSVVTTQDWDFSVRAPIGVVVNRVTLQIMINDIGGIATSEEDCVHAISMDPDDTAFADCYSTASLFDVIDDNADKLAFQVFMYDGDNSGGLAAAGMQMSPVAQYSWYEADLISRPISFRPIRHMAVGTVAVEKAYLATLEYQLAEFTDAEVAAFAATRA